MLYCCGLQFEEHPFHHSVVVDNQQKSATRHDPAILTYGFMGYEKGTC